MEKVGKVSPMCMCIDTRTMDMITGLLTLLTKNRTLIFLGLKFENRIVNQIFFAEHAKPSQTMRCCVAGADELAEDDLLRRMVGAELARFGPAQFVGYWSGTGLIFRGVPASPSLKC